uniref:RPAP1 C-terminal domain-containing protein n=1 Tax=Compsopogon caeruleus TaxID=31354 RepID=A0A7S1XGM6_9RHOD
MSDITEPEEGSAEAEMTRTVLGDYAKLGESAFWRFDLDGHRLSEQQSQSLPSHLGLHHHGLQPALAGYSVPELIMLCRSTFIPQRIIALDTLGKIFEQSRRGIPDCDVIDVLARANDAIESVVSALDGKDQNLTLSRSWTRCLRNLFVVEQAESAADDTLLVSCFTNMNVISADDFHSSVTLAHRAIAPGLVDGISRLLESFDSPGNPSRDDNVPCLFSAFCLYRKFSDAFLNTSRQTLLLGLWSRVHAGEVLMIRAMSRLASQQPSRCLMDTQATELIRGCIHSNVSRVEVSARLWRLAINADILTEEMSLSLSAVVGRIYSIMHEPKPFSALSELFLLVEAFVEHHFRNERLGDVRELCQQLAPVADCALRFSRSTMNIASDRTEPAQLIAAASASHLATSVQALVRDLCIPLAEVEHFVGGGLNRLSRTLSLCWGAPLTPQWDSLRTNFHFCGLQRDSALLSAAFSSLMLSFTRYMSRDSFRVKKK